MSSLAREACIVHLIYYRGTLLVWNDMEAGDRLWVIEVSPESGYDHLYADHNN